jgi:prefoldin subunit 5
MQREACVGEGKKPPPLRTRAPLGSDVEMEAIVEDTSKVLIKGLMGFWAECSQEEAPAFIAVQRRHLERQIKHLDKQAATMRTHVKLTLQALGELNQWPLT